MISKLHYISQPGLSSFPVAGGTTGLTGTPGSTGSSGESGATSKMSTHLDAITLALEAGCNWIQLRVKNEPKEAILEYALEARRLCNLFHAMLIVNDHPEIALQAEADGVHLGLLDMSVTLAREIVGPGLIIGGTANTYEDILLRVREGADYIGLGPYRFTTTKQNLSPILGLAGYQDIMRQVREAAISIPLIAIGGILTEDIAAIMQTGFYGVAMSGAITFSTGREQTVALIHELLHTHPANQAFIN